MSPLRIGTRDSQLAVWQATRVQNLLQQAGVPAELVYIKSEGDVDTVTPLYALGVTGVFTKTLDAALLNNRIDLAVHSMKDVPVQLAHGLQQAAVLKRASHKDLLVAHPGLSAEKSVAAAFVAGGDAFHRLKIYLDAVATQGHSAAGMPPTIATGSVRRIAQWRHRFPNHAIENLRGNVNTRLRKLQESQWAGAIFAAAGLERIHLRPEQSIELDWMLPAPAQGAIMVACRQHDERAFAACQSFNDSATALCTQIERDFLQALMGGCSTPISALAEIKNGEVFFEGNVVTPDGTKMARVEKQAALTAASTLGRAAASEILRHGGQTIVDRIRKKGLTTQNDA